MWARFRRFVNRHIGKAILGVVAIPVVLRMARFVSQQYLEYQTLRTRALLHRFKKQQMFEMMESNLPSTFHQWFSVMKENIRKELDVTKYTERLRQQTGNKVENWSALKVMSFANVLAIVYGSSMLMVLLRIQVNVCSGLLFKQMDANNPPGLEDVDQVQEEETEGDVVEEVDVGGSGDASISRAPKKLTEELQQEYMILTRHLCTEGIGRICRLLYEKSLQVVGNMSLKQKLTVSDLQQIFSNILNYKLDEDSRVIQQERFNGQDNDVQDWCPVTQAWQYMFSVEMKHRFLFFPQSAPRPSTAHETYLRTLVGEAYDLVNGEDAKTILKYLETQGINQYLDILLDSMSSDEGDSAQIARNRNAPTEHLLGDEPWAPMAKLIPVMNSFIDTPITEDNWVSLLHQDHSLKTFSANIYESYSSDSANHVNSQFNPN